MKEKKEALLKFHRDNILQAANTLFLEKGIEGTTVDDIAKAAQYSKATLYVYFKSKDEIVSQLTLYGMNLLYEAIQKAIQTKGSFRDQYLNVCYSIVDFQKEHPFYFECILKEINIDIEQDNTPAVYKEIYDTGEALNQELFRLLSQGMEQGYLQNDLNLPAIIFIFWSSLSGIIRIATQKEKYLAKNFKIAKADFLSYSFDILLNSIKK